MHFVFFALKDISKTLVMPMPRLKPSWNIPSNCTRSNDISNIPKDSQLLRFTPISGQSGAQEEGAQEEGHRADDSVEQAWGVPHTTRIRVCCLRRGHPKNFVLKDAVFFNSQKRMGELVELRAKWFKKV